MRYINILLKYVRISIIRMVPVYLLSLGFAQTADWNVDPDSANVAILKFDFQTYQFEGAAYANYAPCLHCSPDSLPWEILYHGPGDFGDITFQYSPTQDTLFHATIIWMGEGNIVIPDTFAPPESFVYEDSVHIHPDTVYHFFKDGWDTDWWESRADTLWNTLEILGLSNLNMFDFPQTQAGIYLYPPTVGMFDPNPAKWIVFFYQDQTRETGYDTTYALSFFPFQTGNTWQYYGLTTDETGSSSFSGYRTITVGN